jgi:hypothetical protein
MASILAVATALAAGLVALTLPLQEADAETPCNIDTLDIDAEEVENNCDFYGNTKIDASSELPIRPCDPLDPLCNRLGLGQLTEIPLDEDEEEDEDD